MLRVRRIKHLNQLFSTSCVTLCQYQHLIVQYRVIRKDTGSIGKSCNVGNMGLCPSAQTYQFTNNDRHVDIVIIYRECQMIVIRRILLKRLSNLENVSPLLHLIIVRQTIQCLYVNITLSVQLYVYIPLSEIT